MGVKYYAIDSENKVMFELGKSFCRRDTDEDIGKEIEEGISGEPFTIDDLRRGLTKFNDVEYQKRVVAKFNKWKASNSIYLVSEESSFELEEIGYRQTESRYDDINQNKEDEV